jgi:alpha-mannosidase
VPITHHDLGYTDTIENVLNRYDGFYDDVLRFCAETEDWPEESKYRYTCEGTWSLQHYLENRPPKQADKFAKYVAEGRIEIGALFGTEIDALCGHEELVRLMYPSFRLGRRLGGSIRTGSITDVPGLSWGLPTVLAGAGVKYFFAGLPTYFEWGRNDIHTFWDEEAILRKGRPDAFRWQGPDGGSVLVYYQSSYGFFRGVTGPHSYQEVMDTIPGRLADMERRGSPFDVVRYIHNGVDNYPPDVEISHIAREWNSRWAYPKLVVATNTMFFEQLESQCADVRTFRGELPHTDYVVGAISTARETSINRLTHERLQTAEKAATIASIVSDYDYPADKIRTAYDNMLLYDEHTWGKDYPAGELQDWSWNEKSQFAYKAAGLTKSVASPALETIAGKIALNERGRHIVVFNPLCFERTDIVNVTRFGADEPFELVDEETGRAVPHQVIRLEGPQAPVPYAAYRHARGQFENHELFDLVFVAEAVPPVGYKTYRIVRRQEPGAPPVTGLSITQNTIENRFFKVTLDPRSGGISSIYDKKLSREIVDSNAPHRLNELVARRVQTGRLEGPKNIEIRKGQSGPVCASLVVRSDAPGCPQLTQEITLYDNLPRIDLASRVLKDSTPLLEIYFAFPFKLNKPDFRFEGSNSVIEPWRDQFPGSNTNYYTVQHWADVSDGRVGITLSPVDSHLLEFGGLWPCYVSQAHHGVTPPDFGRDFVKRDEVTTAHMYAFVMDSNFRTNFQPVQQGDMLFRYSIATHQGDWKQGNVRDFGWAVCNPLIPVVVDGPRRGALDKKACFCRVDKPNVLVLTLKRAEDKDGIIVRLIETAGRDVTATLTVPPVNIEKAFLTNLVEENGAEATWTTHEVKVPLKAFGIATIRLRTS